MALKIKVMPFSNREDKKRGIEGHIKLSEIKKGRRYKIVGFAFPEASCCTPSPLQKKGEEKERLALPFYLFGLRKGALVKLLGRGLFNGPLLLEINKRRLSVPEKEASAIKVVALD